MSNERNVGELLDKTLAVVSGMAGRLDAIEKRAADDGNAPRRQAAPRQGRR